MNWFRILLFALFCLGASFLLTLLFGFDPPLSMLLCIAAIGLGYAYGTFQMMYVFKKQIDAAVEELKK